MSVPRIFQNTRKFAADKSGNIAMITGLLGAALLTSAGIAIDYTRAMNLKSDMTNALDAAVLSTGSEMASGQKDKKVLEETFKSYFFANLLRGNRAEDDFIIDKFKANPATGLVEADVSAKMPTAMMRIVGYEDMQVAAGSSAKFAIGNIEIAIMLDVTGSMRGQKLTDLKQAAKQAIDLLIPVNNARGVRIALVPYSGSVNVGSYHNRLFSNGAQRIANAVQDGDFSSIDQHGATNTCVTERGGRDAATDASYLQARIGNDKRTENGGYRCPANSQIMPLTNNRDDLKRHIDRFEAYGYTAGHLGIAWSYYSLSENWRPLWPQSSDPEPYGSDVQKFAILMTDGEFNTYYQGTTVPGDNNSASGGAANSYALSRALCDDMKRKKGSHDGITVFSVAFEAPASAEQNLRYCANADTADQTFYYSAKNGNQLKQAFTDIARSISRLRISR